MKLLRAGKRAVQSHIVNHVKDKLPKRTRRSNVIIQLNPANPVGGGGYSGFQLTGMLEGLASTFLGSLI